MLFFEKINEKYLQYNWKVLCEILDNTKGK